MLEMENLVAILGIIFFCSADGPTQVKKVMMTSANHRLTVSVQLPVPEET